MPSLLLAAAVATAVTSAAREKIGQVHIALTGDPTQMAVSFRTELPVTSPTVTPCDAGGSGSCTVHPAVSSRTYTTYKINSGHYHHALVPGTASKLKPDALYSYSVGSLDLNDTKKFSFRAPNPDTSSCRVVYTGDFGLGGAGPPIDGLATANAWAALAQAQDRPNVINWVAGDIAYANMHGAFEFEKTWNSWFDALEPAFAAAPTMVSPGNHETYLPAIAAVASTTGVVHPPPSFFDEHEPREAGAAGSWNFTAFDHRFFMPGYSNGMGTANMWYSFDLGGVHFISIDTETDLPHAAEAFLNGWGDQISWLKADLATFSQQNKQKWLVRHASVHPCQPARNSATAASGCLLVRTYVSAARLTNETGVLLCDLES